MKAITYSYLRRMSFYGFLLPLFFCSCATNVQKNEKEKCEFDSRPVVVETEGFAAVGEGTERSAAHRRALRDARRNAVVQAHTIINTDTSIRGFKVENNITHSRSTGYIEWMQILEAGLVPESDSPVYCVKARACVYPVQNLKKEMSFCRLDMSSTPVVVINISSNLPKNHYNTARTSLEKSLNRYGLNIIPETNTEFAAALDVKITGEPPDKPQNLVISWKVNKKEHNNKRNFDEPVPSPRGRIRYTNYPSRKSEIWKTSGLEIVQDVFRIWVTPRRTNFVFESTHPETLDNIAAAFAANAEIKKEKKQNSFNTSITIPVAGNSLHLANSILDNIGLEHQFEPHHISFTRLQFIDNNSGLSGSENKDKTGAVR